MNTNNLCKLYVSNSFEERQNKRACTPLVIPNRQRKCKYYQTIRVPFS